MGRIFLAVTNPIYVIYSHTKFGCVSFNGKGGDSITDDARKCYTVNFFSRIFINPDEGGTVRLYSPYHHGNAINYSTSSRTLDQSSKTAKN